MSAFSDDVTSCAWLEGCKLCILISFKSLTITDLIKAGWRKGLVTVPATRGSNLSSAMFNESNLILLQCSNFICNIVLSTRHVSFICMSEPEQSGLQIFGAYQFNINCNCSCKYSIKMCQFTYLQEQNETTNLNSLISKQHNNRQRFKHQTKMYIKLMQL